MRLRRGEKLVEIWSHEGGIEWVLCFRKKYTACLSRFEKSVWGTGCGYGSTAEQARTRLGTVERET